MQAGKRDQPVYFQYPVETNRGGQLVTAWTGASGNSPDTPDWAFVLAQKGTEAFEAARTNAREAIRLCVGYRSDVLTTWRVLWNGQTYSILHVDRTLARRGELWITAEVVGAA